MYTRIHTYTGGGRRKGERRENLTAPRGLSTHNRPDAFLPKEVHEKRRHHYPGPNDVITHFLFIGISSSRIISKTAQLLWTGSIFALQKRTTDQAQVNCIYPRATPN
jgi:hypothetical protein